MSRTRRGREIKFALAEQCSFRLATCTLYFNFHITSHSAVRAHAALDVQPVHFRSQIPRGTVPFPQQMGVEPDDTKSIK